MSVRVMTAVWELPLPDSEKIVLLALADCANDEGHCWPSMATLARKCSKSDRTVQAAIKALVEAGHLTRSEVPGKGCNYTVHPRKDCTPEDASPPKPVRKTPEAASDKPSKNHHYEEEANASPSSRAKPKTLMSEDWEVPAVSELPPKARACAEQWTRASYETHGEAFKCFWRSERRMKGDWRGTWANRVIALHSQVMRDQKFGNAPTDTPSAAGSAFDMAEYRERMARLEGRGFAGDARHAAPTGLPRAGKPQTLADVIRARQAQGST